MGTPSPSGPDRWWPYRWRSTQGATQRRFPEDHHRPWLLRAAEPTCLAVYSVASCMSRMGSAYALEAGTFWALQQGDDAWHVLQGHVVVAEIHAARVAPIAAAKEDLPIASLGVVPLLGIVLLQILGVHGATLDDVRLVVALRDAWGRLPHLRGALLIQTHCTSGRLCNGLRRRRQHSQSATRSQNIGEETG
eukprot:scaffold825_cov249-Pinguiococcus_pyrenoidosus.AAC.60